MFQGENLAINITGSVKNRIRLMIIKVLLRIVGVKELLVETRPDFDEWVKTLPKDSIPFLGASCLDWIRFWGNGGGDFSSESCIASAIKELESDIPAELAEAIYNSVVDYSKSPFEAIGLTMEIINGCIEELQKGFDE